MGKFKDIVKKATDAFINAVLLEEKYTILGIYDKGEILITRRPDQVFLQDTVSEFALIRHIEGEGRPLGMNITAYNPTCVDYDLGHITELFTWESIVDDGLADCVKDDEDKNPLRFTLMSRHPISAEIFDLLLNAYPETDIRDILPKCQRMEAAMWALEHGADKYYNGFKEPSATVMYRTYHDKFEGEAIFKYVYGCDPKEYWETVKKVEPLVKGQTGDKS